MRNKNLKLQLRFIEKSFVSSDKQYKIFLSDERVHNYFSNLESFGGKQIIKIKDFEFFDNYTFQIGESFFPSWIRPEDSNFYILDLGEALNLDEKKELIKKTKRWSFYGKGIYDSDAYLLVQKNNFELYSFEEELKLENIVLDMANLWNLEILFEKFKKN